MQQFGSAGLEAGALQRIIESTQSLQTRVFRIALRRSVNHLALKELAQEAEAIAASVRDLEGMVDD